MLPTIYFGLPLRTVHSLRWQLNLALQPEDPNGVPKKNKNKKKHKKTQRFPHVQYN